MSWLSKDFKEIKVQGEKILDNIVQEGDYQSKKILQMLHEENQEIKATLKLILDSIQKMD